MDEKPTAKPKGDEKKLAGAPVKITLSKPVETHGGTVSVLELKEPSADMVLRHGFPWKNIIYEGSDGQQRFELEYIPAKMALYIEEMTGVDRETLGDMSARDMSALFTAIVNLLQPSGN